MSALTQVVAQNVLDAVVGTAAFVAPTGAAKLELDTAVGSQSAAGTAVTGGSYADQTIAFSAATAQTGTFSAQNANSAIINFAGMPVATVTSIAIKDSAGTPRRAAWGLLTANKTTGAGDTISFAVASVVIQI